MRYVIGFLTGVLGLLAGWFGLAMLVIALAGPDRDGGIAMGAFFQIGPVGGLVGFVLGVLLFIRFGQSRAAKADAGAVQARRRVAPAFAVGVLLICAALGWWGWYVFIRSPYLTHGFMTLSMQFKLPPGMALPAQSDGVHITVYEGSQQTDVIFGPAWHGTEGASKVILATATLSMKTSQRVISLELPGVAMQSWFLDLSYDPDPMPGFTDWKAASGNPSPAIEMNYQLSADQ